jgi:hypothetical protein
MDDCPWFYNTLYELSTESTPVELGGPGVIVQIDESLFNHKSKYNRGRRASKEQWVFGLADTYNVL